MFDVHVIDNDALMVARLMGILDAEMTQRIVEFIEIKEMELETGFNRFCDMTRLEGISLSSHEVMQLAARRSAFNPNDIHVKSAFFAVDPLSFGMARMYELLLDSPRIEVRVFSGLQAVADWLGVKMDRLVF